MGHTTYESLDGILLRICSLVEVDAVRVAAPRLNAVQVEDFFARRAAAPIRVAARLGARGVPHRVPFKHRVQAGRRDRLYDAQDVHEASTRAPLEPRVQPTHRIGNGRSPVLQAHAEPRAFDLQQRKAEREHAGGVEHERGAL